MQRTTENPTVDERGDDVHPAFGLARVNRRSHSPGEVLFDSEITHQHTVVLTLSSASRRRDLHRDWLHQGKQLVEFEMSEAQWGALVSSFGDGGGVPVTIRSLPGEPQLPGVPPEHRLALSEQETRNAATRALADITAAWEAFEAQPNAANRRTLKFAIANGPGNIGFAAKSLTEHVENVVTKARADIEATAVAAARRAGAEAIDAPYVPAIGSGKDQS